MAGHKPYVLVGGATGMIGDPSGKSQERNLLDRETLNRYKTGIRNQLARFLDFENGENKAEMVDNYDWMKDMTFLDFIRDIGKHITVNYMMAKDSVKSRITGENTEGMSFTEFTYQLVQGYDFFWLFQNRNCKLQMGGSDQWGNITTGTELIRRKVGGESFALTIQLIKKSDGTKFGKTEKGNVWLDAGKTSPYTFYQFWFNASDEDAERYLKIFTLLSKEEIEALAAQHSEAPERRILQQKLAQELTVMVHSHEAYENAVAASQILFGKSTKESLLKLDEATFLDVFAGVPQATISREKLNAGIPILDLLAIDTTIFPSKGELRRTITGGGLNLNNEKVSNAELAVSNADLICDKYLLVRKGKKDFSLIIAE